MTWLENPQNEAEKLLRDGLDLAAQRTGDEITHRRVWGKVADALLVPESRISGRLVLVSASAAVAVLAVAGVVIYPYVGSRPQANVAANPPVSAPSTEPKTAAPEPSNTMVDQVALEESERAPGKVIRTRRGERARVALGGGAVADLEENSAITWNAQHRPSVEQGSANLSVPHQPPGWRFSVTAGPYIVTVVGTRFKVEVGSRTVGVEVSEGIVEVGRGSHSTRLTAGDTWHGPLYPDEAAAQPSSVGSATSSVRTAAPLERPQAASSSALSSSAPLASAKPVASMSRGLQEAQSALQSGDVSRAMDILSRAAQGSGPAAENAAYELARITRYNLGRPRQAVALWDKYRNRFPAGLLRTEADLSIVDTLSQLGDVRGALTEANAFIARHPNSERRVEVQRLVERLRAAEASSESR
jgi:hypothetical protein